MMKKYYQWFYEPLVIQTMQMHNCAVADSAITSSKCYLADSAIHINSYSIHNQQRRGK